MEIEVVQELNVGVVIMVNPLMVGDNVNFAMELTTRTLGTPSIVNVGAQASPNGGING